MLGATNATITGGEALLNPDWRDIVKAADDLLYKVHVFTTGVQMKDEDADFLSTVKNLSEVQLSLYSMDNEVHNSVTGVAGSCQKTKTAIGKLMKRGVPTAVSCCVIKENIATVPDVMRWCDDNGVNSCCSFAVVASPDRQTVAHRPTDEDMIAFFNETMKDGGRLAYVWGKSHEGRDIAAMDF